MIRLNLYPRALPRVPLLLLAILSGALLLSAGCFTGCANKPTAQAVAYFTLADTRAIVDRAEYLYGDAVAAGKVTPEQERDVDEKIVRFHAAYKLAVRAARVNYLTRTPDDLQKLADELVQTINTFAR